MNKSAHPKGCHYLRTDCAVIGAGLAGCTAALELADGGAQVDLFVKETIPSGSNSYYIAGGLAAVPILDGKPAGDDALRLHVRDTLAAGKSLNDTGVVEGCVRDFCPEVIRWLEQKGVRFDTARGPTGYSLHREGGHSRCRVFHIQDRTGEGLMNNLARRVRAHPRIRLHEHHMAIDLISRNKLERRRGRDECLGVYVYDIRDDHVQTVACKGVFVATGGLGKVFMYTTNPDVATGDGFALCYRAGLPLANMEFIQFHPSVFYDAAASQEMDRRFLFTEALRGAGAILKLRRDDRDDFVLKYDPKGSNATRDIVTRAEDSAMRRHGLKHLWLDCTRIGRARLRREFQNAYDFCRSKGIDLAREPVPIVYAVHYSNGGVITGEHGETLMRGCYVLGETAYTGLHGATRLASNSGSECVLFARRAAAHFRGGKPDLSSHHPVPPWDEGRTGNCRDKATVSYYWETVRRTMTGLCGVARNTERLSAANEVLASIRNNVREFYWHYRVSKDFLEVRNIADVARIIVWSALARNESRACHFREDYPQPDDSAFRCLTIVQKNQPVLLKDIGWKGR